MKAKDLRSMSKQELNSKLEELRKEMIKHNAQISTGTTPKSPGQVREIKKTIAKILTIVGTQKEEPSKAKAEEAKEAPKTEEKK
ncbi:50S ribosomal protein L29 [Candidatus Woesearchaeota archaeon]|nr:50S ribosomal protein L29 [Candidatus Woesearchaeota archaeon]